MRRPLLLLLIVNALLLPAGCWPALRVINAVNPAAIYTIAEVQVTNSLERPITVTPIGYYPAGNVRLPVMLYASRMPALLAESDGAVPIRPGETKRIFYSKSDAFVCDLVVRLESGSLRQVVLDPSPQTTRRRMEHVQLVTVEMANLQGVSANLAALATDAERPRSRFWRSPWLLLPWVTFPLLLLAYRRRPTAMPASV